MNSEKAQINMKRVDIRESARVPTPPPPPMKRRFPVLIATIVLANVILFVVTMYENNCPKNSLPPAPPPSCFASFLGRFSFQPLKQNPFLGPSDYPLIKMGALHVDKDKLIHVHQAWRLFSSLWLNAGVIQLLINMFALLIIGIPLEKKFGFVRIGLVYLISGLGGNLLSALFTKSTISVGASPAIFGLLGSMLSELLTNWTMHPNKLVEILTLIVTIIIYLALGTLPIVDNFSHIGGFISGFLLGFVFLILPQYSSWVSTTKSNSAPPMHLKYKSYQYALWTISFMLLSAGFISGLVLFLRGVDMDDYCYWCHYLRLHHINISCDGYQSVNQLNITCLTNGRSGVFPRSNGNPLEQYEELCFRLCGI